MNGRADRKTAETRHAAASDEELLALFVRERSEDAFAELVRRHGPLVLGVCRRMLADAHDADDAFQATFLVLALRGADVRRPEALAAWLYGVAFRTARRLAAKRRRNETMPLPEDLGRRCDPLVELTARHDRQVIDEELNRLPAKYRDPLVLYYLLGRPKNAIAEALGESVAAIDGRMKRGRQRLRVRLTARGVSVAGSLAAVALTGSTLIGTTVAKASPELIAATASAAKALAGGAMPAGADASSAIQLARQELAAMTLVSTTKTVGALVAGCAMLLMGLAGAGLCAAGRQQAASAPPERIQAAEQPAGREPAPLQVAQVSEQLKREEQRREAEERRKWEVPDYKRQSPAEQRIREALEQETAFRFVETPLSDVVEYLKDVHHVEIQLDKPALEAAGLGADTPIEQIREGISLRSALRLMLGELGLAYVVRNSILQITTIGVAESFVETKVYELRRLTSIDATTLVAAIRATVRPETWSRRGVADPARRGRIMAVNGALVVTQSQRGQEEVLDLLRQLENFADNPLYAKKVEESKSGRVEE